MKCLWFLQYSEILHHEKGDEKKKIKVLSFISLRNGNQGLDNATITTNSGTQNSLSKTKLDLNREGGLQTQEEDL